MSIKRKNALGKGLTALLSDNKTDITSSKNKAINNVSEVEISKLEANPFQPREDFGENELNELSESIKIHGLIQPITIRKIGFDKYQIISGERRTKAAIRAGLEKIPAYIRIANDQSMLEMALIENTHREDLNTIEISLSYKRLMEECNLNQEQVAKRVGKGKTTIVNYLRMLKLPEEIQLALRLNKILMGHARPLINIKNKEEQLKLFLKTINEKLSVRKVEELAKKIIKKEVNNQNKNLNPKTYPDLEKSITQKIGSKAKIKTNKKGRGEIIIKFESEKELKRIVNSF